MKKCNNCKIEVNANLKRCPLCNKELIGDGSIGVFPKISFKQSNLLKKILRLVSISVAIISIFLEYYITKKIFISRFIVFGLITNYILVLFILKNYKNVLKMMNKYFFIMLLLLILWYFATRSLIITTYFIPILCIVIYIFNTVIMMIYRRSYVIKYTRTIILDSVIGLLPLLLTSLNLTTINLISYISVIMNIIVFLGVLIFFKDNVIEELRRTFNI